MSVLRSIAILHSDESTVMINARECGDATGDADGGEDGECTSPPPPASVCVCLVPCLSAPQTLAICTHLVPDLPKPASFDRSGMGRSAKT